MTIINSLWIGEKLSTLEWLAISSHLAQGHEYHLWVYDDLDVPKGTTLCCAHNILWEDSIFSYKVGEGKGSVSAFSNLFRYRLLNERGGWWCDTDVVALKPFDFDEPYVFASEMHRNGSSSPTTCVIKVPTTCTQLTSWCYVCSMNIDKETLGWGTIGPKLWSEKIFELNLEEYAVPPSVFCPTHWFDAEEDPPMQDVEIPNESHAVHIWHEMWRRKGVDKDGHYPGSLYERLKDCFITDQMSSS